MTASFSLTHLTDGDLLRQLSDLVARDRKTTAALVAHLAEVERRKLHFPEGYDSLLSYCLEKLRLSRDEALRRISAARLGRRFPIIFDCIADGRLTLTTVNTLRRYVTRENGRELLKAALNRSKSEVEAILAARFPVSELLPFIDRIPSSNCACTDAVAPERLPNVASEVPATVAATQVDQPQPQSSPPSVPQPARAPQRDQRPSRAPIAAQRFGLHLTMPQSLNDKIEYLQELLSHSIPSGDLVEVLEKICELAICQLEKKKFGVTSRSRTSAKGASVRGRHIPYAERRKVLARDGHQCTFTSASGNRCSSRTRLEFHHDGKEFARGGESTTDNLRLRCKPHNQYEAEQSYGVEFVAQKREESRNRARAGRVKAERVAAERTRSIQVNSETAGPNETNGGRDVPTAARARSA